MFPHSQPQLHSRGLGIHLKLGHGATASVRAHACVAPCMQCNGVVMQAHLLSASSMHGGQSQNCLSRPNGQYRSAFDGGWSMLATIRMQYMGMGRYVFYPEFDSQSSTNQLSMHFPGSTCSLYSPSVLYSESIFLSSAYTEGGTGYVSAPEAPAKICPFHTLIIQIEHR